jgi:hypothetical protein
MNTYEFDVEITRSGRVSADLEIAEQADREVWNSAAVALRELVYDDVRVRVEWSPWNEKPAVRLHAQVIGDGARLAAYEAPAFVELFFHDAFLLFNIAVPGSFGGVIAPSGGPSEAAEIVLASNIFELAWIADAKAASAIHPLPLAEVVEWYEGLRLGMRQIAADATAAVLLHLLHIARGPENEPMAVLRLAQCLELLEPGKKAVPRLFEIRDALVSGEGPVTHPMHDDGLDPRLEDPAFDWTEAVDEAAARVVAALQGRVRTK